MDKTKPTGLKDIEALYAHHDMLKALGLKEDDCDEYSKLLLKLGKDMAKCSSVPIGEAHKHLFFIMLGNSVKAWDYKVNMTEPRLRVCADATDEKYDELSVPKKVLLRYEVMREGITANLTK